MNPLETQLDHYKVAIDTIFTRENLPAILAVMNSLLPKEDSRIGESEYHTVVKAAFFEGAKAMTDGIINFTAQRNG